MNVMSYKRKNGITLVELLITIAILSIVLGGIYSLFIYGNKTYKSGTIQYDLQSKIRIASDIIVNDIRYASDIEFIEAIEDGNEAFNNSFFEGNYTYIYLSQDKKSVKLKKKSLAEPITLAKISSKDGKFELSFERANSKELLIIIKAIENGKNYEVKSQVEILNIHLGTKKEIDDTKGQKVDAIRYIRGDVSILNNENIKITQAGDSPSKNEGGIDNPVLEKMSDNYYRINFEKKGLKYTPIASKNVTGIFNEGAGILDINTNGYKNNSYITFVISEPSNNSLKYDFRYKNNGGWRLNKLSN